MSETRTVILDNKTLEKFENMVSYYDQHKPEELAKTRPSFVADDLTAILNSIGKLLKQT